MGAPHLDLTGQTFGRLTVIRRVDKSAKPVRWECLCVCGNISTPATSGLRSGQTNSCGCLSAEIVKMPITHGFCVGGKPPAEYHCWENMKARCNNPNHASYKNYGGRGIKVCDRWNSFENFFADMGPKPAPKLTIERGDNDSGYNPENCIWASQKVQNNNKRPLKFCRNGHFYTPDSVRFTKRGETVCKKCAADRQRRYRAKRHGPLTCLLSE